MIHMPCPGCNKDYQLADVLLGQLITCIDCGTLMRVAPVEAHDEPLLLADTQLTDDIPESIESTAPTIGVDPERLTAKRLRKKKRRRSSQESFLVENWHYYTGALGPFGFVLIALFAGWFFATLLSLAVPRLGVAMGSLGNLLYMVGWLWIVFIAYRDDGWSGTMCLMTGFYTFAYIYMNLEGTWKPAGLMLVGVLMMLSGFAVAFYLGA